MLIDATIIDIGLAYHPIGCSKRLPRLNQSTGVWIILVDVQSGENSYDAGSVVVECGNATREPAYQWGDRRLQLSLLLGSPGMGVPVCCETLLSTANSQMKIRSLLTQSSCSMPPSALRCNIDPKEPQFSAVLFSGVLNRSLGRSKSLRNTEDVPSAHRQCG
jgi:hypothetical protein